MKKSLEARSLAFVPILLAVAVLSLSCGGGATLQPPPATGFTLVWSDEFNGADGSSPDSSKWTYDTGGNGWGNNELECYTNLVQNAQLKGGNLVITAIHQPAYACSGGTTRDYTSARLKTQGLFSQAYGRFEARIKIPAGQGMWPAFWMLGNNITSVGWPTCGEIDIMENIGKEPGTVHGSLHGPSSVSRTSDATAAFSLPAGQNFADDFHLYAVEWEPGTIRFYVDSNLYATFTHLHAIPVARRRNLGLRSSLLHSSQRRRRRRLARLARHHHHFPTANARRLRPRLHQALSV